MENSLAIGVDLGATKIATALVTRTGQVLEARETLTRAPSGPEVVCDRIAHEVQALLEHAQAPVLGIGIGSPGLVNGETGIVRNAVNLGWKEVALAGEIARRVPGCPVFAENDANAAAVGEGFFGSAIGSRDYVLFTVGSGLGAGVVSNGRLVPGAHGVAADLGHWPVDLENGRLCHCGRRGCAETVVSGPGLVATTRSLLANLSRSSVLPLDASLTAATIVHAARRGDSVAREAIHGLAVWLGHMAALVTAVLDPDIIVIGGGLGIAAVDLIMADMKREMKRRIPPFAVSPAICASTLPSSAMGSASLVWSHLDATAAALQAEGSVNERDRHA